MGQIPKYKKGGRFCRANGGNNSTNMKNFVRLLALLMACLFCVMAVVACDDDPVNGDDPVLGDGSDVIVKEDGTRWKADAWGYARLYDNLPDELDYDDQQINILYWSDVEKPEFEQKDESNDVRLSNIFNRNLAMEQRLGITLKFIPLAGNSSNVTSFTQNVRTAKESNQQLYDLIGTYSRTAGSLMTNGLLIDVLAMDKSYIDLKQPWWPAGLVDNFRVADSLYFLSGDMSITAIDELHAIYFNKELIDREFEQKATDAGSENGTMYLYDLVYDGKWTIDQFISMAHGRDGVSYYQDLDNSGTVSKDDQVGVVSASYVACTLYGGANLRMIDPDPAEKLVISPNYTSARTVKFVRTLSKLFGTNDYYDYNNGGRVPFDNGRALFAFDYLEYAENNLMGSDAVPHYGLVPLPKYDEKQVNYYTVVGNAFSIFCIPRTYVHTEENKQEKLTMLSAILECWASEAYRKTTPAVFELNMQLKYSETQDETNMCEYVRAGITFDLGRVFDSLLGFNGDGQVFQTAVRGESWVTTYSSHIQGMKDKLQDFVSKMDSGIDE